MRRRDFEDLTGRTFGRLYVICESETSKVGKIKWVCLCVCGNTSITRGDMLRSGCASSCGCFNNDSRRQRMTTYNKYRTPLTGSMNPNWRGGKCNPQTLARSTAQYEAWRKAVFERDDFTCCKCGDFGGKLEAHHILSFSKYKDYRFDLTNGVTLCKQCHNRFHDYYGKFNFTANNMLNFLIGDEPNG